ncbi:hypothetical protein RYH80_19915 [Halobaculum sp. MBLA0147]|uniref:hypothetical protein n=1 Tax=Halobaculum sp. MBLA0147 TaxID=3079934 RepID=UPI0035257074
MRSTSNRDDVAWDIETTGFTHSDKITVTGLWYPDGWAKLILNTQDRTVDRTGLESNLANVSGGISVEVIAVDSEEKLVDRLGQVVFETFDRDYNRLVAFNADSWQGGFDLPFLRTRCIKHGVDWVFDGLMMTDLWEPVSKRLNTTYSRYGKSDDTNSLSGAHRVLCGAGIREEAGPADYTPYGDEGYDPFDSSGSAVSSYRDGDFLQVCKHNLADIHRTWELSQLVRSYVSGKDTTTKKL